MSSRADDLPFVSTADIEAATRAELNAENRRAAVDAAKVRLRLRRPWWHRVIPFTIKIERRA